MEYIHARIYWDDKRARKIAHEIDEKIYEIGLLYKELERLGYVRMGEAPAEVREGLGSPIE